jgi:hypothetical protein
MEFTMQATQSNTASGSGRSTEQFAALGYVSQHLGVNADETPRCRRPDGSYRGIGQGGDITREAGELLGVLHLNSTILGLPGLTEEDRSQFRSELTELIDRTWALLERLLERSEERNGSRDSSVGEVFLKRLPCAGTTVHKPELTEYVAPVRGVGGWNGRVLEQAAAGWIAC